MVERRRMLGWLLAGSAGAAFRKPATLRSALMASYGAVGSEIGIAFGAG